MVRDAVATNLENSPWHKIAKNQPSVTFIRHNEEGFSLLHGLQRPPVSSGKDLISVSLSKGWRGPLTPRTSSDGLQLIYLGMLKNIS